jgi:uncharacterized protein YdeI (YjbR/CyaY-like superfamily)
VKPRAFKTAAAFRAWLTAHHDRESELMLRLYKTHARAKGMGYREALDEALCFGWIDGVRRALDEDSFTQRFTPRRARSVWSAVNIKRATELEAAGRMHAAGRAAFGARQKGPAPYSFESGIEALSPALLRVLKANRGAWEFHQAQPPGYRRITAFWIMSAKQEKTRLSRLEVLIGCAARGERIPLLKRPEKK